MSCPLSMIKTRELDSAPPEPLSHIDTDKLPRGSFVVGLDTKLYQKSLKTGEITLSTLHADETANKDAIDPHNEDVNDQGHCKRSIAIIITADRI